MLKIDTNKFYNWAIEVLIRHVRANCLYSEDVCSRYKGAREYNEMILKGVNYE
jgi:hypothetical protein